MRVLEPRQQNVTAELLLARLPARAFQSIWCLELQYHGSLFHCSFLKACSFIHNSRMQSLYAGDRGCCNRRAAFGTWIQRLANTGSRKEFRTYWLLGCKAFQELVSRGLLCAIGIGGKASREECAAGNGRGATGLPCILLWFA